MEKFLRSERDIRRLLRGVRMQIAAVNLELPINGASEFGMRNHSADGALDQQLRMTCPPGPSVLGFVPTDETGKTHETLLLFLFASQAHLFRVDHDDEIARVDMRGVNRLVLAPQDASDFAGEATQHHALGVDEVPGAGDVRLLWGEGPHPGLPFIGRGRPVRQAAGR